MKKKSLNLRWDSEAEKNIRAYEISRNPECVEKDASQYLEFIEEIWSRKKRNHYPPETERRFKF